MNTQSHIHTPNVTASPSEWSESDGVVGNSNQMCVYIYIHIIIYICTTIQVKKDITVVQ